MLGYFRRFRERWRLVPESERPEYQKKAMRAANALREVVRRYVPNSAVISFGPPDRPGGQIFAFAFQTEQERIEAENSESLRSELTEVLLGVGYSKAMVDSIQFQFCSEEKHRIFTWLER